MGKNLNVWKKFNMKKKCDKISSADIGEETFKKNGGSLKKKIGNCGVKLKFLENCGKKFKNTGKWQENLKI